MRGLKKGFWLPLESAENFPDRGFPPEDIVSKPPWV
jgi:hypothetical protein